MEPVPMAFVPPPTGKTAFQQGLIFGVIQAVIASAILLTNAFVFADSAGLVLLMSVLSFFTGLAAYIVAGILAARNTGKVKAGTFAGMWTGGIYGIIGFVVSMILFFQVTYPRIIDAAVASGQYTSNIEAYKTGAMIGGVGVGVFGLLFAIGLGAGLGALGGLIGRKGSRFKPVQMVPVMYAAYPGQPVAYAPGQPFPAPVPPVPYVPGQPAVYPLAGAEQIYSEQPASNSYNAGPYAANPYVEQQQQQQ